MRRAALFLATGAYSGLAPIAPGTAGSLVTGVALLFVSDFKNPYFLLCTALLLSVGIWAAAEAEAHYKRTDAPQVVIDEIVGMLVSVAFLPATLMTVAIAFVCFRLFDIAKPFPIRQAESVGELLGPLAHGSPRWFALAGGLGVMLDDVIAGVYANLATRLVLQWIF